MAYLFTLLFIAVAYITPEAVFGPLAEYRIEVVLALLAIGTSLPNLLQSHLGSSPKTYVFFAFCMAIPMSILASGWVYGAAGSIYGLMPLVLCFFLPAANFRTRQHLQWMILVMVCCSGYFICSGLWDLQHAIRPSLFLYGDGELRRLRGLGFVYDPNDLSQVLVSLLPMVFLWKSKNRFLNVFLLGIPIALLVTGMYFTHSRGAALALMATLIIALRRKIGTVPAAILAGSLFAASLAVGWSGGRDVSVEAGGDRLDAWSTGLQFIKSHPLFGVGAGRFSEFNEITAHNSVVVCAAELGLPGFICWVFLIFSTLRSAIAVNQAKPAKEEGDREPDATASRLPHLSRPSHIPGLPGRSVPGLAGLRARVALAGSSTAYLQPAAAGGPAAIGPAKPLLTGGRPVANTDASAAPNQEWQAEIRQMARLLVCSLTGFLVAGWFLSRALSMWLFFYFGMTEAVFRMAQDAGMQPRRDSFSFLLRWSIIISVCLLMAVYGVLKFRALTGR